MKDDNVKNNKEDGYNVYDKITFIGLLALLLIFSVNAIRLGNILNLDYSGNVNPAVGYTVNSGNNAGSNAIKDNVDVIPKGIPAIYGKELGVSFDDVNVKNPGKADETIRKFGNELNKRPLTKIRFLSKEYAQLQETIIIGEYVGIAIFTENPYCVLIKDKVVAEGYRKQFEILWDKARR